MQTYKVVEFSVKSDGSSGVRDYKAGLAPHKAQALADKLNMAQDHEAGDCLLSYRAERQ